MLKKSETQFEGLLSYQRRRNVYVIWRPNLEIGGSRSQEMAISEFYLPLSCSALPGVSKKSIGV